LREVDSTESIGG